MKFRKVSHNWKVTSKGMFGDLYGVADVYEHLYHQLVLQPYILVCQTFDEEKD